MALWFFSTVLEQASYYGRNKGIIIILIIIFFFFFFFKSRKKVITFSKKQKTVLKQNGFHLLSTKFRLKSDIILEQMWL